MIRSILLAAALVVASVTAHAATINLNTADAERLTELDGIGPVKAEAIVEYRDRAGGFSSVDELLEVDGVGEATLDANRDQVTVQ